MEASRLAARSRPVRSSFTRRLVVRRRIRILSCRAQSRTRRAGTPAGGLHCPFGKRVRALGKRASHLLIFAVSPFFADGRSRRGDLTLNSSFPPRALVPFEITTCDFKGSCSAFAPGPSSFLILNSSFYLFRPGLLFLSSALVFIILSVLIPLS